MSSNSSLKNDFISLPKGGGAMSGLGEKFAANLQTGTGNFSFPIALPKGRNNIQPEISIQYSTGNPNGIIGLGWNLSIPEISRKTSKGIPTYDDEADVFILSGFEDLVRIDNTNQYRPRTEEVFAQINYIRTNTDSFWEVKSKNGLLSYYGTHNLRERDSAVLCHPTNKNKEFLWKLTETRDLFGNRLIYHYSETSVTEQDTTFTEQLYVEKIQYVNYQVDGNPYFLVEVDFEYESRFDQISNCRSGFEIRTSKRLKAIHINSNTNEKLPVKKYEFTYTESPHNRLSLLSSVQLSGYTDDGTLIDDQIQPIEFGYSDFRPESRGQFFSLNGYLPIHSLAHPQMDVVDLHGNGLPDLVEFSGVIRYWKNRGDGSFESPQIMDNVPSIDLTDRNFQLMDADGDGRTDIFWNNGGSAGFFSLENDGKWDKQGFKAYRSVPSINLKAPTVRLFDLDGDGLTDMLDTSDEFNYFFNDEDITTAWQTSKSVRRKNFNEFPDVNFADARVKYADLTGDGLQDLVFVQSGSLQYWPNLGQGNWGARKPMRNAPQLPMDFDPRRVLLGDIDGDGLADFIYADNYQIHLWLNQAGRSWSDEIIISGLPQLTNQGDVRIIDILGTGVSGVLWSSEQIDSITPNYYYLNLAGSQKPYLLNRIDNQIGSVTQVEYRSSTQFYLEDRNQGLHWQTQLPFPVQVVAKVIVIDEVSKGKLVTQYAYHHGHWDGEEREYRGFGMVEQTDTETFDDYNDLAHYLNGLDFAVSGKYFSPPIRTKNWFHLGPVRTVDGEWITPDYSDEYWVEDKNLLDTATSLNSALGTFSSRRKRRDALRTLRSKPIRSEVYAVDLSPLANRPYTVSESAYELREESADVYFPYLVASRSTIWERGDDPLTSFTFLAGYDAYGQPTKQTKVAMPRRMARRANFVARNYNADFNETRILAICNFTVYVNQNDLYIKDRVAQTKSYEFLDIGERYEETDQNNIKQILVNQYNQALLIHQNVFRQLLPVETRLFAHSLNFFDGPAYEGLPNGEIDQYGALTRTETLVFRDAELSSAFTELANNDRLPSYLTGNAPTIPGTPADFGRNIGYHLRNGGTYETGYYIDTVRNKYDFQDARYVNPSGLLVRTIDPLDNAVEIGYDLYNLLPVVVRDAFENETRATYNYRVYQPNQVIDPNGNKTNIRYNFIGLPDKIWLENASGGQGGTEAQPDQSFSYSFQLTTAPNGTTQPMFVHTATRTEYRQNDIIETREYSDGFGRVVHKAVSADAIVYEDNGLNPVQGQPNSSAVGATNNNRVVVSGWQVYNNKGWVVETYEPFYAVGFEYKDDQRVGEHAELFYDPIGRMIRTINPDGSQIRHIFGTLTNLTQPDVIAPSSWEEFIYDANDLFDSYEPAVKLKLADRVPAGHYYTPVSLLKDAMGRTLYQIQRNGPTPDTVWYLTQSTYDIRNNVLIIRDAKNRIAFTNHYDLLNRILAIDSIDAGYRTKLPDANGNLIEYRDSKGSVILHTYDSLNRPAEVWARDDGTQLQLTLRERLQYGDDESLAPAQAIAGNFLGRLWKHYDEAGVLEITGYDFKGNIVEKTRRVFRQEQLTGQSIDWSAINEANEAGVLYPAAFVTTLAYDAINRLTQLTYPADVNGQRAMLQARYSRSGTLQQVNLDGEQYIKTITYNARGQRTLIVYGNDVITRYAYDPETFRLVRLRTESSQQPAGTENYQSTGNLYQDFGYSYDLAGNITTIYDRTADSGILNTVEGRDALDRLFEYDAIYRLISTTGRETAQLPTNPDFLGATRSADPTVATAYTERYTYDEAGNMAQLSHSNNGVNYNRLFTAEATTNRLRTIDYSGNVVAYRYDGNGNLTENGSTRKLNWDHSDRLIRFTLEDGAGNITIDAHYRYDAAGNRILKKVSKGGNTVLTVYIDGLFEYCTDLSRGEENNTLHIMDNQSRIATKRVGAAMGDRTPEVHYHLSDHLGSCNIEIGGNNASQRTRISREEYSPYGETTFGSYPKKRFRYSGKEQDKESGFYYYGARYYAPWMGRWGSCDPIGLVDEINLYSFVSTNPINLLDRIGNAGSSVEDLNLDLVKAKVAAEANNDLHSAIPAVQNSLMQKQAALDANVNNLKTQVEIATALEQPTANPLPSAVETIKMASQTEQAITYVDDIVKQAEETVSRKEYAAVVAQETRALLSPDDIASITKANEGGKVARFFGAARRFFTGAAVGLEVTAGVVGSAVGGYKVGTGIDKVVNGKTGGGLVDIGEGSADLALTIGTATAVKGGTLTVEAGLAAGGLSAAAGVAAGGSVALVAETARAAVVGQATPIDIADQYYGTSLGDLLPQQSAETSLVYDVIGNAIFN